MIFENTQEDLLGFLPDHVCSLILNLLISSSAVYITFSLVNQFCLSLNSKVCYYFFKGLSALLICLIISPPICDNFHYVISYTTILCYVQNINIIYGFHITAPHSPCVNAFALQLVTHFLPKIRL